MYDKKLAWKWCALVRSQREIFATFSMSFQVFSSNRKLAGLHSRKHNARKKRLATKASGQNYYTRAGPTKPQNSWWCLPAPPCLTSKDGVFIA